MRVVVLLACLLAGANAARNLPYNKPATVANPTKWTKGAPLTANKNAGSRIVFDSDEPGQVLLEASTDYYAGAVWELGNVVVTLDGGKVFIGNTDTPASNDVNEWKATPDKCDCASNYNKPSSSNPLDKDVAGLNLNQFYTVVENSMIAPDDIFDYGGKPAHCVIGNDYLNIGKLVNVFCLPANTAINDCNDFEAQPEDIQQCLRGQFPDLCNPEYPDGTGYSDSKWYFGVSDNCAADNYVDSSDSCLRQSSCASGVQLEYIQAEKLERQQAIDQVNELTLSQLITWSFVGPWDEMSTARSTDKCTAHVEDKLKEKFFYEPTNGGATAFTFSGTATDATIVVKTQAREFYEDDPAKVSAAITNNGGKQLFSKNFDDSNADVVLTVVRNALLECDVDSTQDDLDNAEDDKTDAVDNCAGTCSVQAGDPCTATTTTDGQSFGDMFPEPQLLIDLLDQDVAQCNTACEASDFATQATTICNSAYPEGAPDTCEAKVQEFAAAAAQCSGVFSVLRTTAVVNQKRQANDEAKDKAPQEFWIFTDNWVSFGQYDQSEAKGLTGPALSKKVKDQLSSYLPPRTNIEGAKDFTLRFQSNALRRADKYELEGKFNFSKICPVDDTECQNRQPTATELAQWGLLGSDAIKALNLEPPLCRLKWNDPEAFGMTCAVAIIKGQCADTTVDACVDPAIEDFLKCTTAGYQDEDTKTCFDDHTWSSEAKYNQTVADIKYALNPTTTTTTTKKPVNEESSSGGSGASIIPIVAAVAGAAILIVIVIIAVKKGWIGGKAKPTATSKGDRNVVAFENPMYDEPTKNEAPGYADAGAGGSEGLYDEPAFQGGDRSNPLYESTEDISGGGGGYLDTEATYEDADGGGYLDTEPADDTGGYLDVAPDQ